MDETRKANIREGMRISKENGRHIARPLRFVFTDDLNEIPQDMFFLKKDGKHRTYTLTISESRLFDYARRGYSLRKVAAIIGISPSTLYYAMRADDGTDSRFRGTKDRYTEFMRLSREAKQLQPICCVKRG